MYRGRNKQVIIVKPKLIKRASTTGSKPKLIKRASTTGSKPKLKEMQK
jgi:hypothetical protein